MVGVDQPCHSGVRQGDRVGAPFDTRTTQPGQRQDAGCGRYSGCASRMAAFGLQWRSGKKPVVGATQGAGRVLPGTAVGLHLAQGGSRGLPPTM